MRTIPIDEHMTQAAERASLPDRERFRQQQAALYKQERHKQERLQGQRDTEAPSAEMPGKQSVKEAGGRS